MSIDRHQAWAKRFTSNNTQGWKTRTWILHQNSACDYLQNFLREMVKPGFRVLEIGSGNGRIIGRLAKNFPSVYFTASDFIQLSIEEIKNDVNGLDNVEVVKFDAWHAEAGAFENFDIIFSVGDASALSHRQSIENIFPALRPGQVIICDFINHFSINNLIKFWTLPKIFFRYYLYRKTGLGKTMTFYKFGFKKIIDDYGLKLVRLDCVFNNYFLKAPIYLICVKN